MYKNIFLLLVSLFILAACSTAGGPSFSGYKAAGANDTGVYLYRLKHFASGFGENVLIDGKPWGTLKDNGFLYTRLTPGTHTISMPYRNLLFTKSNDKTFTVSSHEIKYFKIVWSPSGNLTWLSGGPVPEWNWSYVAMPASAAKQEMQSLNLSS